MKILNKVGAAVATAAIFATVATSAFASTSVTITGNGKGSDNAVSVSGVTSTNVTQVNESTTTNIVGSSASTGGNYVGGNTGGNSSVDTGSATSKVNVGNTGGSNEALVLTCGCTTDNTTVGISKNGKGSSNVVSVSTVSVFGVSQSNASDTTTIVGSSVNTGHNKVKGNTGGSSKVTSGMGSSTVNITNTGSTNIFSPFSI